MVGLSRNAISLHVLGVLLIEMTAHSMVSASDCTDGISANEQAIVEEFEKRGGEVIFDWTGEFDLHGDTSDLDSAGGEFDLHGDTSDLDSADGKIRLQSPGIFDTLDYYSEGGEIHADVYVRFPLFYLWPFGPSPDRGLLDALPTLKGVEALDLRHTHVTDKDLCIVSQLRDLKVLLLDGTLVTDDGLSHLKNLTRLEQLHLDGIRGISAEGLKTLAGLPMLRYIHAVDTAITDHDLQTLKESFPNATIDISTPRDVPMHPKIRLFSSEDEEEEQTATACRTYFWRTARRTPRTMQWGHFKRWRKCPGVPRRVCWSSGDTIHNY